MMNEAELKEILEKLKEGKIKIEEAVRLLKEPGFEDFGFAKVDLHRTKRKGFPEVIFCPGKTPKQVGQIAASLLRSGVTIMATRADEKAYREIKKVAPGARYHEDAGLVVMEQKKRKKTGLVVVACAGTADLSVAEEAALTAEIMGNKVERFYDVGIAGVHRLFAVKEKLEQAQVIVAVAGMEGALPSLIAGLVSCPVIGVPTSVGYGSSLGGLTALFAMLNSCAEGIAVVNIDNGFGAGYMASLINKTSEEK